VAALVSQLKSADEETQYNAISSLHWLLKAPGSAAAPQAVGAGLVPSVLQLLHPSTPHRTREEAAWVACGLTLLPGGAMAEAMQQVWDSGGLPLLATLLASPSVPLQEASTFTLGHLAAACPDAVPEMAHLGVLRALLRLVHQAPSQSLRLQAACALCDVATCHEAQVGRR
jgi:hypothetical protein